MAVEGNQPGKLGHLKAGADLSGKQFYFVKISGNDTVDVCSGLTDRPIGVLQNKPTLGQACEIVVVGLTKVSSDAALTAGNLIGTSADGQAASYSPAAAETKWCLGQVTFGSGAAAEIATAYVNCASLAHGGS